MIKKSDIADGIGNLFLIVGLLVYKFDMNILAYVTLGMSCVFYLYAIRYALRELRASKFNTNRK